MIKWMTTSKFDSATITSLNAATGYSASNVTSRFLKQTWRTTGLSNQWIKFNMGSASQIDAFTAFYNNLTTSATVTLYGHTSDLGNTEASWSGATYKQVITNYDRISMYKAPATSLRWWLLGISDSGNPDGYIEIGRIFAGATTSPSLNFNENFSEQKFDSSEQSWTIGGHVYSTQRERFKTFDFQFLDMSSADQLVLRTFWDSVKKTEPFVLLLDTDNEPVELTRYGVLTSDLEFAWTSNNRVNVGFKFRELR